ncbi:MAG: radical SAM protein [Acidobacteria bacterium]|nr:radical SAM protein [Acidobacteriota bacterium]
MENAWRAVYDSPECRDPWGNPSRFAQYIDVELTNRCNLRCVFCARQKMVRPLGLASLSALYSYCREAKACGARGVRFIRWGEPTLHPHFPEAVSLAKISGLLTHVTTNGLKLRRWADWIDGLDSMIVSMQGVTPEGYRQMRGDHYDEVVAGIETVMAMPNRPHVTLSTTILDECLAVQEEFRRHWEPRVDAVQIGYTTLKRVATSPAVVPLLHRAAELPMDFRCKEILTKLSIDWDGTVTACCTDYDRRRMLGHVSDGLQNLWDSPLRRALCGVTDQARLDLLTHCSDCELNFPFRGDV